MMPTPNPTLTYPHSSPDLRGSVQQMFSPGGDVDARALMGDFGTRVDGRRWCHGKPLGPKQPLPRPLRAEQPMARWGSSQEAGCAASRAAFRHDACAIVAEGRTVVEARCVFLLEPAFFVFYVEGAPWERERVWLGAPAKHPRESRKVQSTEPRTRWPGLWRRGVLASGC